MVDFFIDRMVRMTIAEQCKMLDHPFTDEEILARDFATWKAITRNMLLKFPALFIYDTIEECLKEIADEQYFEEKNDVKSMNFMKKKMKVQKEYLDLDIVEVAKRFGLNVKHNKVLCPFHADGDASMVFYPDNHFHCFGCGEHGDVVKFYKRLKETCKT